MTATTDYSALASAPPWHHYSDDPAAAGADATARTLLRTTMGASYVTSPTDVVLDTALALAVDVLTRGTGRMFVRRIGQLSMSGTGSWRLHLPQPVVSVGQGGTGVTSLIIGVTTDTAVDSDSYTVNDGIGIAPDDPRDRPFVDLLVSGSTSVSSSPPEYFAVGRFPLEHRSVHVTAEWGYVDESGNTPALVRQTLAQLVIRALVPNDDPDERETLHEGAIKTMATQGRSWTLGDHAAGAGLTTDRQIDMALRTLRRPPAVVVSKSPRRRRNYRRY